MFGSLSPMKIIWKYANLLLFFETGDHSSSIKVTSEIFEHGKSQLLYTDMDEYGWMT